MMKVRKIVPFIPHYCKAPNTFLRYRTQMRISRGLAFTETIAVYKDKKGEVQEDVCRVKHHGEMPIGDGVYSVQELLYLAVKEQLYQWQLDFIKKYGEKHERN